MIFVSENIQLQKITIEDQPKLITLVGRVYPPVYKHLWKNENYNWYLNKFYSLVHLQKELDDDNADYFFVIYKLQTVGIFRIHYSKQLEQMPKSKCAYLHRIYLGKEAQGKGVAKLLFEWSERQAKQKGRHLMWLKAMDTQQQALRFYNKQGYREIDRIHLDFDTIREGFSGMIVLYKTI